MRQAQGEYAGAKWIFKGVNRVTGSEYAAKSIGYAPLTFGKKTGEQSAQQQTG